jgi:hypothetical protein
LNSAALNLEARPPSRTVSDIWAGITAAITGSNSSNVDNSTAPAVYLGTVATITVPFVGNGVAISNGNVSILSSEAARFNVTSVTVHSIVVVPATLTAKAYIIVIMVGVRTGNLDKRQNDVDYVYFSKTLAPDPAAYENEQSI